MAHFKTTLAFLAFALFLIATPHSSHGLTLNGQNIAQVQVLGTLYCSATGNPDPVCGGLNCPPLSGAPVTLSCFGGRTTLGQAVTNTSGFYEVAFNTVDSAAFDPSACSINVTLPVAGCAVLPPTGNLRATLTLVEIVSGVLGAIATFVSGVVSVV